MYENIEIYNHHNMKTYKYANNMEIYKYTCRKR